MGNANAEAALPVGAISGVPDVTGGAMDVAFSWKREQEGGKAEAFTALDERIFAICFQKVKVERARGKPSMLELRGDIIWQSYSASRNTDAETTIALASLGELSTEDVEEVEAEIAPRQDRFEVL
jgi:hypothetical protein